MKLTTNIGRHDLSRLIDSQRFHFVSQKLLANKVKALTIDEPTQIVTANIGCQLHIETASPVPVNHWIELLDR